MTTTNPYSPNTNWTISHGSLNSIISYESFDFPIQSDSITRKPPLLLLPPPPSSDFQPCQIKLNFTKKHEIRQVYIRSTARIYEIYYAPTLQSDDEYLCTVRCSAAVVEDNLFPNIDVKEVITANLDVPGDVLPKTRVLSENKIVTNEDDWVEIKLPADGVVEGKTYLPNEQNYYEATAEINDSEPCMSLTLRLLSLQSKGCVYIDEVYVFADPIDTNDSEDQTVNAENSSNSSLMTMLVPTLLGLTKSRSAQLHDQKSSNAVKKPIEPKSGPATLTNPVNLVDQQGDKLLKQSDVKVPDSTPDKDNLYDSTMRNDFSYNRAESLLEQLFSRVSRIEDVILRFEENMLKPINSIEARLERVEQQIELLSKTSQSPRFESNLGSTSNAGNSFQLCNEPELEKLEVFSNGTREPPEDTAVVASTQVHEGLVTDEKDEPSGVLEPPKVKPKKTISIDDALAAALAGFSSFTEARDIIKDVPLESHEEECLQTNQASIDTNLGSDSNGDASSFCESPEGAAPEFTGEEIDCDDNVLSSTSESSLGERGESSTTPHEPYTEIPDHFFRSRGDSEVSGDEVVDPTLSFNFPSPRGSYKTDPHLVKQDSVKEVKILTFDKNDILKHFPDQSPDDSCSPNAEDANDESASKVSFESQFLELTSASLENGSLDSHLEALFSYTDDPTNTDKGSSITPQINEKTATVNNLLVDLDDGDVSEGVIQDLPPVEQETSFASLI